MARIGYARVSSFDQDHATQAARLKAAVSFARKRPAERREPGVMNWRLSSNLSSPVTNLWS